MPNSAFYPTAQDAIAWSAACERGGCGRFQEIGSQ